MDYSDPIRADRLAAEYVLGTLHGGARRRFETLLPSHPWLRRAVARWQVVLVPLAASVRPAHPDPEVWVNIQERLFGPHQPLARVNQQDYAPRWWEHAESWRNATLACLIGLLVMSLLLWLPRAPRPPLLVVLTPSSGPASFVATVAADGRSLVLAPIGGLTVQPTQTLVLWALPRQGSPRSLGPVAANRATTITRSANLLDNVSAFGLSIEAATADSTHPNKPVMPMVSTGKLPPP